MTQSFLSEIPPLVRSPWPGKRNISVIRGDLLHPVVSGNKLFKLIPIVQSAKQQDALTLMSVGGRFSNHLHALAWVGKKIGMKTVGIVQGYENQHLTPTLVDCLRWGMSIHFIDKLEYRRRYEDSFWLSWQHRYPNAFRINEGGWSEEAIRGGALWWEGIEKDTDIVICAVGSGSTMAGLAVSTPSNTHIIGVPVFKDIDGYEPLKSKFKKMGLDESKYSLWQGFAGKGFGKLDSAQARFMHQFTESTGIPLDPVYTTKVFHALTVKLESNSDLALRKIAIIHTGGLQGCRN